MSNPVAAGDSPPKRELPGKLVVGTGWWSQGSPHNWQIGSQRTRSVEFFDLWYRQVLSCLNPHRIVVTDSASPLKPDHAAFDRVEWIELDRNYGHPNDIRTGLIDTKYCGFTRTVLCGAMYALCCDADWFVYVEQDCLIHGPDFLNQALAGSSEDILLGQPTTNGRGLNGNVAAPMLQQSLMIVRRAGLERFISGIIGADWTDGEVSPEETMRIRLAPFGLVGVPYGRSRPIDFSQANFYAQHMDEDELAQMRELIGASESPAAGGA